MGIQYDVDGQVVFEGEYKNGQKCTWKGKEKYKDILLFQGEYLNGLWWNGKGSDYEIKNGKGYVKERDKYGQLIFEGEYINGVKNGKGKAYNEYGKVIFEGEFLNGIEWKN